MNQGAVRVAMSRRAPDDPTRAVGAGMSRRVVETRRKAVGFCVDFGAEKWMGVLEMMELEDICNLASRRAPIVNAVSPSGAIAVLEARRGTRRQSPVSGTTQGRIGRHKQ